MDVGPACTLISVKQLVEEFQEWFGANLTDGQQTAFKWLEHVATKDRTLLLTDDQGLVVMKELLDTQERGDK